MPLRRTAYVWTVHYDDPLMAHAVAERVSEGIQIWLAMYPKTFSDGWMAGTQFGLLQVGMTVTRRDRWECQRQARKFAHALAVKAKVRMAEVADPDPANLPSHDHRGRRRFLAPKYLETSGG